MTQSKRIRRSMKHVCNNQRHLAVEGKGTVKSELLKNFGGSVWTKFNRHRTVYGSMTFSCDHGNKLPRSMQRLSNYQLLTFKQMQNFIITESSVDYRQNY
jgi:hypothetical protein